jgi:hypothetical protein
MNHMRQRQMCCIILLLSTAPGCADEPAPTKMETVEIPLSRIVWSWNMPIDCGEPRPHAGREWEDVDGGKGFAVPGTGKSAYDAVLDLLHEGKQISHEFAEGTEISLVFFSQSYRQRVLLEPVRRQGKKLEIRYRYERDETKGTGTRQFALIPLGVLPPGSYHVSIVASPDQVEDAIGRPSVAISFDFTVLGRSSELPEGADGLCDITVPLDGIWGAEIPGTRDVTELMPQRLADPLLNEIVLALHDYGNPPSQKSGFLVRGMERQPLVEAHAVLVKNQIANRHFTGQDPLSIVFFTPAGAPTTHLCWARRQGNRIIIAYEMSQPTVREDVLSKPRIALIPIGYLGHGQFSVTLEPLPPQKVKDVTVANQISIHEVTARNVIGNSFEFSVAPGKSDER